MQRARLGASIEVFIYTTRTCAEALRKQLELEQATQTAYRVEKTFKNPLRFHLVPLVGFFWGLFDKCDYATDRHTSVRQKTICAEDLTYTQKGL